MLVVAHPDDEVLWFASLLPEVDFVVVVYEDYHPEPELGNRRRRAIGDLPYEVTSLSLAEPGSLMRADWEDPQPSQFGLALNTTSTTPAIQAEYERTYHAVVRGLRGVLTKSRSVFTHNPWGEYGHEDHVHVFQAVDTLRKEIDFEMYGSCYYSARSTLLAGRFGVDRTGQSIRKTIDPLAANRAAAIYKKHGCWTWADDWTRREEETFFKAPAYFGVNADDPDWAAWQTHIEVPASVTRRVSSSQFGDVTQDEAP